MRATTIAGLLAAAALCACSHGERKDEGAAARAEAARTATPGEASPREAVKETEEKRHEQSGKVLAEQSLAQWKRDHPDRDWVREEHEKHVIQEPADNSKLIGQGQGQTYGRISAQDVETWKREVQKAVAEGSRIFHSAEELGSPIAVSCDMCHPDAANTHPETYPKFQVQMGRVAQLRDMINWCIEHPVRGVALEPDSPKMRALESYILAQRKGTPLDFGRR
jgi:hypothetical protein